MEIKSLNSPLLLREFEYKFNLAAMPIILKIASTDLAALVG